LKLNPKRLKKVHKKRSHQKCHVVLTDFVDETSLADMSHSGFRAFELSEKKTFQL